MATRRQFSADFKAKVVLEVISGRKSAAAVCREYHLKPTLLVNWKKNFVASAPKLFEREHQADPAEVRIAELERLVGKLTLELDVAKKAFTLLELPSNGNEL
jgi:transposase-like protein